MVNDVFYLILLSINVKKVCSSLKTICKSNSMLCNEPIYMGNNVFRLYNE